MGWPSTMRWSTSLGKCRQAWDRMDAGEETTGLQRMLDQEYFNKDEGKALRLFLKAPGKSDQVAAGKVSTLQAAVREQALAQRIEEIEDGEWTASDQYDVIVFDPPWETMSREELEGLHIYFCASANCVLWIWTTHRHILDAFFLIMRWGFHHTFVLTWVKDRMGQRPRKSEFCIMAESGSPKFTSTNPTTVIEAPARQKNGKPDEFYEMVDSFCVGSKLVFRL